MLEAAHKAEVGRLESMISYIKEMVTAARETANSERAEFKRAVDALLVVKNAPAIGQGTGNSKPLDSGMMRDLLGFMEEPGETDMTARHPAAPLTNKVD
jgi:hypothetical protein